MGNDYSRIKEELQETNVETILQGKKSAKVVTIEFDRPVSELIQLLKAHSIMSVPVIKRSKMIGFVGLHDIVDFLFSEEQKISRSDGSGIRRRIDHVQHEFTHMPVDVLVGMHENNQLFSCQEKDSLWDILNLVAQGAPRLAVFDENHHLVSILSQMDIICYLAANTKILGSLRKNTPGELKLIASVLTIAPEERVSEAFRQMIHQRTEGIAVVDEKGDLMYHLSMSDFKYLYDDLHLLSKSCRSYVDFVNESRQKSREIGSVFSCTVEDRLSDILREMAKRRIHRIYVVENNKGVGILSIRRVCRSLFHLLA